VLDRDDPVHDRGRSPRVREEDDVAGDGEGRQRSGDDERADGDVRRHAAAGHDLGPQRCDERKNGDGHDDRGRRRNETGRQEGKPVPHCY